jgi:hypothetical protein
MSRKRADTHVLHRLNRGQSERGHGIHMVFFLKRVRGPSQGPSLGSYLVHLYVYEEKFESEPRLGLELFFIHVRVRDLERNWSATFWIRYFSQNRYKPDGKAV